MHGLAEKYFGAAMCKLSECDAVKIVLRLVYAVAIALVLQVLILTYVAYKLT